VSLVVREWSRSGNHIENEKNEENRRKKYHSTQNSRKGESTSFAEGKRKGLSWGAKTRKKRWQGKKKRQRGFAAFLVYKKERGLDKRG